MVAKRKRIRQDFLHQPTKSPGDMGVQRTMRQTIARNISARTVRMKPVRSGGGSMYGRSSDCVVLFSAHSHNDMMVDMWLRVMAIKKCQRQGRLLWSHKSRIHFGAFRFTRVFDNVHLLSFVAFLNGPNAYVAVVVDYLCYARKGHF